MTLNINDKLPVVEMFYSIQGEGYNSGYSAYFIRLAGCDVCCNWCDEKVAWDLSQYPLLNTDELLKNVLISNAKAVVITGGEPFKHNLELLSSKLKENNITLMAETSGTEAITGFWDWITMSPKIHHPPLDENYAIVNELKVVIQKPEDFLWAEANYTKCKPNTPSFLQAEWNKFDTIMPQIISYVKKNPHWRLSVQTHKFLNIP